MAVYGPPWPLYLYVFISLTTLYLPKYLPNITLRKPKYRIFDKNCLILRILSCIIRYNAVNLPNPVIV